MPGRSSVHQHVAHPDPVGTDRRSFLKLAATLGVGLPLLTACGALPLVPSRGSGSGTAATVSLPTYMPVQTATPDLPPNEAGVQAGYFTYPKQLVKSVSETPGAGGAVTAFTQQTSNTPPTPLEQNAAWQEINNQLNATMQVQIVTSSDYPTKVATMMAGNDLSDLFYFGRLLTIANIPQFLQSSFADLTPYLGGDAVRAYPNLAAFPQAYWAQTLYANALYAIPVPRPYFQWTLYANQNLVDSIGSPVPKNADDFKQMLKALTRPQANQWGIGAAPPAYGLIYTGRGDSPQLSMFRVPNNWAVDANGKFTKDIEAEEFRMAVSYVRELFAAGYYFPDPIPNTPAIKDNLVAGKYAVAAYGWTGFQTLIWDVGAKLDPPVRFRMIRPFSYDGGTIEYHQFQGLVGMTALKKAAPERVKELLRILNYLAAPFGSQESMLLEYGLPGVDHTMDDRGNPVLTTRGTADTNVGWQYLAARLPVLFDPVDPEYVKTTYADEQAIVPHLIADPSQSLYSATDTSMGGQLTQRFADGLGQIVRGEVPLSDLDRLIADWRSGGGDQMRNEYQQAYADSMR